MRLKSVFTGLASLVLGLSLSQANAAYILVDDFTSLGAPPTTTANTWASTGINALQGVRDFTKNNGGQSVFGGGSGLATLTTSATSGAPNVYEVRYDGTAGTGSTLLTPPVDISSIMTPDPNEGALFVEMPQLASGTGTTITATLQWQNVPGGSIQTSTLALGASTPGTYKFKINSFSNPLTAGGLANIRSITVRLNNLAGSTAGLVTSFDKIYFFVVPEPGTFALAALGVVGLFVARRKRSAK
jgi:hypothetical protein